MTWFRKIGISVFCQFALKRGQNQKNVFNQKPTDLRLAWSQPVQPAGCHLGIKLFGDGWSELYEIDEYEYERLSEKMFPPGISNHQPAWTMDFGGLLRSFPPSPKKPPQGRRVSHRVIRLKRGWKQSQSRVRLDSFSGKKGETSETPHLCDQSRWNLLFFTKPKVCWFLKSPYRRLRCEMWHFLDVLTSSACGPLRPASPSPFLQVGRVSWSQRKDRSIRSKLAVVLSAFFNVVKCDNYVFYLTVFINIFCLSFSFFIFILQHVPSLHPTDRQLNFCIYQVIRESWRASSPKTAMASSNARCRRPFSLVVEKKHIRNI